MIAFFVFGIICFAGGAFVGFKFGSKAVADAEAAIADLKTQVEAWKVAAQKAIDEVKSKLP